MRAPCSLGEAKTLRALLATAGFRDIRLHTMILTIRHLAVTEFLAGQLAATPVAAAVAALDAAAPHGLKGRVSHRRTVAVKNITGLKGSIMALWQVF
jgi:hypothetical protein